MLFPSGESDVGSPDGAGIEHRHRQPFRSEQFGQPGHRRPYAAVLERPDDFAGDDADVGGAGLGVGGGSGG
jgi:hypothetical protein